MISLVLLVLVGAVCFATLFLGRRSGGYVFFCIPVSLILYFLVSTEIFSFGFNIPVFPYHASERESYYFTLIILGCAFLAAFSGKQIASFVVPPLREKTAVVTSSAFTKFNPNRSEVKPAHGAGPGSVAGLEVTKVILAVLPVAFALLAAPLADLWDRASFNADYTWQRAMVFADTLFWFAAIVIPTIRIRSLKYACLFALVLTFASLGERQAPIALLLFVLIDRFVMGHRNTVLQGFLGVASAWLLVALISLRPDSLGGTYQIALRIMSPVEIPFDAISYAFNYMTNFSVIVNSIAIERMPIAEESFWYGVSPLPSAIYDDTGNYLQQNSILSYVPLPGFGFLVSFLGPVLHCVLLFVLYFVIELMRNCFVRRRDTLDSLLYGTLVLIPVLFSLQYNLRATTRLFYVLLLVYAMVSVVRRVSFKMTREPLFETKTTA